MKEWLEKVQAPKFLRYLFFIAYSWYRRYRIERSDAHFTAILFVAIGYMLIFAMIIDSITMNQSDTIRFIGTFGCTGLTAYFLFFYKEKWKLYVEEFKNVPNRKKKQHIIYLFICYYVSIELALIKNVFGLY